MNAARRPRVAHLTTTDLTLRYLLLGQLAATYGTRASTSPAISAPGPHAAALEAEGVRHLAVAATPPGPGTRGPTCARSPSCWRLLRRERFDLLHTHNPKPGHPGPASPPAWPGSRGGQHRPRPLRHPRRPARASGSPCSAWRGWPPAAPTWSCTRARRTCAGPPDPAGAHRTRPAARQRHRPRPLRSRPGRRDGAAELRRELGLPDGALVVGAVGRLVAEKGYRELFAAAREIRRQDRATSASWSSAPPTSTRPTPSPRPSWRRAAGDVVLRRLARRRRATCSPSWTCSCSPPGGRACHGRRSRRPPWARPLVLTDIRGCREVARARPGGPAGARRASPGALAAAILRLADDPAAAARLGAAARARARSASTSGAWPSGSLGAYRRPAQGAAERAAGATAGATPRAGGVLRPARPAADAPRHGPAARRRPCRTRSCPPSASGS